MKTEEKKWTIVPSNKILNIPKYIFAELDEWKDEIRKQGRTIIDLGIGNPDGRTPDVVVESALASIKKTESHAFCLEKRKYFPCKI